MLTDKRWGSVLGGILYYGSKEGGFEWPKGFCLGGGGVDLTPLDHGMVVYSTFSYLIGHCDFSAHRCFFIIVLGSPHRQITTICPINYHPTPNNYIPSFSVVLLTPKQYRLPFHKIKSIKIGFRAILNDFIATFHFSTTFIHKFYNPIMTSQ